MTLIKTYLITEDLGRNTHLLFEITTKIKFICITQLKGNFFYGL